MRTILTMAAVVLVAGASAVAQDQTVHKMGDGVKAPVLVREVKPTYTENAMRRKVQGLVELSGVVKTDGTITDIQVTQSLDPELDEQAIKAFGEWTFKPGVKDGQAVNVQINVEMTFTLRSK